MLTIKIELIFRKISDRDSITSIDRRGFQPTILKIPGETVLSGIGITIRSRLVDSSEIDLKSISSSEAWLDFDKTGSILNIRPPLSGDRFVPLGMSGSKMLKSYFIDEKIPKEDRCLMPVLTNANGDIIWVYGRRIGHNFRIISDTQIVLHLIGRDATG